MPLVFNADHLPHAVHEYVAWVDVMGIQAAMSRSVYVTANFVFKLHAAALQAPRANVHLYPVMDGFYAACPTQTGVLAFLHSVLSEVASTFNGEAHMHFRFVVRGGLAFGPVIHGESLPAAACPTVGANDLHKRAILLGQPMVQAHLCERAAPPFGIMVHESARTFAPPDSTPLRQVWWTSTEAMTPEARNGLRTELPRYFDWCSQRALRIEYLTDRIEAHREMARQYLV